MAVITKTERIDLRIDSAEKQIIEKAAQLNHLSVSSYILSICLKQAELDLKQNEMIVLNKEGYETIMALLDDNEPNDALRRLMNEDK